MINYNNTGDRYFLVPFLLGGLAGGAIGAYSRPRPVYVTNPYPQNYYPQGPYGNYSYSYYYPYPR
ncbi:MAG: hypothetical protein K6G37_03740 [Bacilli bacterium]|nr:hypothetical protein [Bacilli bacterium]